MILSFLKNIHNFCEDTLIKEYPFIAALIILFIIFSIAYILFRWLCNGYDRRNYMEDKKDKVIIIGDVVTSNEVIEKIENSKEGEENGKSDDNKHE